MTIEVPEGARSGLLGPAGAGKTTLSAILGLCEHPDSGVVRVAGTDVAALSPAGRREWRGAIARVDTTYVLHPERTAAGNVAAPLERAGFDAPARRRRVAELIDLIGLNRGAAWRPAELTEGQRRRVALARALALRPSVLITDGLTDDLPAEQSGAVLAALDRAWAELGVTVLVATTDAGVVRRFCDHVSVLSGGRLLESGSMLELLADQNSYTARSVLPAVGHAEDLAGFDAVADVVLVGHATVGSLLPDAGARFGVELATLGGGLTRIGDTPVARFRLGVTGEQATAAVRWIGERGGYVSELDPVDTRLPGVHDLLAEGARELAGTAA
nr:ATP-binding cassette domain-containing protein [Haloechinothrix sp. LS1_15]